MNLEQNARAYFSVFQDKDLDALSEMFDDDVSLKDWNISAQGKQPVLEANRNIFDSLNKIGVEVQNLYESDNTVVAEILISTDADEDILPVVDIITFGPDKKIQSIVAYRGN
jgi:ketosteroid isomerase-like protein